MDKFSNGLTDAEAERLALLIEECAEVQQIACKILRHGYASTNPIGNDPSSNRDLLEKECGHVQHAIARLTAEGDLDPSMVNGFEHEKAQSIGRWLHHQGGGGNDRKTSNEGV
jgi:hypothetical protein